MKRILLALSAVLFTSSSSGAGELYRDGYNRNTGSYGVPLYRSAPDTSRNNGGVTKDFQKAFPSSPAIGTKGMYGYGNYQSVSPYRGHFGDGSAKWGGAPRKCSGYSC